MTLEWEEMCEKHHNSACLCVYDCRSHSDEKHPSVDVFAHKCVLFCSGCCVYDSCLNDGNDLTFSDLQSHRDASSRLTLEKVTLAV